MCSEVARSETRQQSILVLHYVLLMKRLSWATSKVTGHCLETYKKEKQQNSQKYQSTETSPIKSGFNVNSNNITCNNRQFHSLTRSRPWDGAMDPPVKTWK